MTTPNGIPWSATPGLLSEGPRWQAKPEELLWVDILGRKLHRGRPAADGTLDTRGRRSPVDRHVGAVAPAMGGGYVLAAGPGYRSVGEDGVDSRSWLSPRRAGPMCG